MNDERIYLASPYSSPDPQVREHRFLAACKMAGKLISEGNVVFSPIAHSHYIALYNELPGDFAFWQKQCLSFLRDWATRLYVCRFAGWQRSKGLAAEVCEADRLGIPVTMAEFPDWWCPDA